MRLNPFNPQQPARPDFFVGREPEITRFEKFLAQTIQGSPMNMSITGSRGIGKTSLLMKFEALARDNKCLVIRLSNYEGNVSNIVDFGNVITANLRRELISRSRVKQILEKIPNLDQIQWKDMSISLTKKYEIEGLFISRLLALWDEIKKDYAAVVILLDEAESLEKIEGALPFLREVFQKVSADAKFMLVLSGRLNFHERMSESFSPLNRFFPVSKLTPLEKDAMTAYAYKKLSTVSVTIDNDALQLVSEKSEGHPYVFVAMLYLLFDSLGNNENHITKDVLNRATEKIYANLAQDFFSPMYHPLTKKAKVILRTIAKNTSRLEFSFSAASEWTRIDRNYLSPYIQELLRKGVLNKPERGHYQIFHSLFLNYIKNLPDGE